MTDPMPMTIESARRVVEHLQSRGKRVPEWLEALASIESEPSTEVQYRLIEQRTGRQPKDRLGMLVPDTKGLERIIQRTKEPGYEPEEGPALEDIWIEQRAVVTTPWTRIER